MTEGNKRFVNERSKDWFWSAFGGTIIGLLGLLLGTILSNLSSQVATVRNEISGIAEKVAASTGRTELYRDRFTELDNSMRTIKEQVSQLEQSKESFKEKFETLNKMLEMLKETEKEIKLEIKAITEKVAAPVAPATAAKQ